MLKHMQSYELILRSEVPKGCQILQSKMDLKTKKDVMGRITKRKARLVLEPTSSVLIMFRQPPQSAQHFFPQ